MRKTKPENTLIKQTQGITLDETTCKTCHKGKISETNTLPSTDYAGIHNGKKYTRIDRKVMECDNCNQRSIQMDYFFDPKMWK